MKHGRDEEDRGSESSKSSLSAASDTTVSSAASSEICRGPLPAVGSGGGDESHCRQRVANVVSKMNGLLDYMVDFRKKEVTVRGKVHTKKKKKKKRNTGFAGWEKKSPSSSPCHARTLSWFLGCYGS